MARTKQHLDEVTKELDFNDTDSYTEERTEEQEIMTAILNGDEEAMRDKLGDDVVDRYLQRRGMAHINRR